MNLLEEYNELGYTIIGAAFEVMRNTGKGLREKYYEKALIYELKHRNLNVKEQVAIPALYKGIKVDDSYLADIIVEDKIIIEVKAINYMTETECRQLLTYLYLSTFKLGYLINFGARDFVPGNTKEKLPYKKGIYRFINFEE